MAPLGERCLSLPGQLGDRLLGASVVDDLLAVAGGGDAGGGGGVVEGTGDAVAEPVEADDGVVGEEGVAATREGELVAEVGGGVAEIHGRVGSGSRSAGRERQRCRGEAGGSRWAGPAGCRRRGSWNPCRGWSRAAAPPAGRGSRGGPHPPRSRPAGDAPPSSARRCWAWAMTSALKKRGWAPRAETTVTEGDRAGPLGCRRRCRRHLRMDMAPDDQRGEQAHLAPL